MKAVVMETREKEAVILLKDGTFRIVKGKYTAGETIDYREKVRLVPRKWMSIAAAAVLMLGTGGGFWYDANYVAYAEISVDVNPSVIYTVNKQSRVLEVKAVNDEANEAVSALQKEGIRFMPVDEAIEKTMSIFESEGYLSTADDDYVLLNISADDSHTQESLAAAVETGMEHAMENNPTMEFRVDRSDRETARRASEYHMSTGRYAVWEQEGGERKPEEYAEMPIREVMGKPETNDSGIQDGTMQPETGAPAEALEAPMNDPDQTPSENTGPDAPAPENTSEMPDAESRNNTDDMREPEATNTQENKTEQTRQPQQGSPEMNPEQNAKPEQQGQEMNKPAPKEGAQPEQNGSENQGQNATPASFPVNQGSNASNPSQSQSQSHPEGMTDGQAPGMTGDQPPK